ncbi:MAG: (Fe-S)-binding protein [Desulfobacteraceae bacterium]|nr:(Fe-S)-binding protein [Desulfobacterales bacterium]MBL6966997.1 (Fe-S)-binding protein [Desulfobacteraceae bacterium]MBL7101779.1 (Fe-S)-binding protein [Desulfobacteraceae bacterium]MBL7172712.1 (Fe-S)-binding protein [Desulfobacteraceae bacterium]
MNIVQLKKLSYDEVAKCNRCGFCLPNCPVYKVEKKESASPRGRNAITRAVIEGKLPLSGDTEQSIFSCLGCGACTQVCLSGVVTKDLIFRDRECQVAGDLYPKIADRVAKFLESEHNISDDDNEERGEWQELIKGLPDQAFEKKHADVIFFVGCVASFFPMAQKIPANMARIMQKGGVDFAILGGEEWCCGFPLIGAGMPDKVRSLMDHNLEKIRDVGAKAIVFTCPSCFHTWKNLYQPDVELYHASQMLDRMIKDGRITLKGINATVTYHDPCDLGRNSGVFEEPREVLKAIPGIRLVELANNRQLSVCCGGGGNVEMVNPDLSARVAQMKLDEIAETGADTVVSACQQCLRTVATRARRQKMNLNVKDLTEMVVEAMN